MDLVKLHKKLRGKIGTKIKVKIKNNKELSYYYTPGVAAACQAIARDKEMVYQLTAKHNTVAVVTDGSAVLGLGNIGPQAALPVMEGKALLFKQLAGLDAVPISLATQDTEEIIQTIKNISPFFGAINLEDISAPRCFVIEERLNKELDIPVFHDDQHATAIAILAGLFNALKLANKKLDKIKILVNGAGASGLATVNLLHSAGAKNIVLFDSKGMINKKRKDLNEYKKKVLSKINTKDDYNNLPSALINTDVFIGLSKAKILRGPEIKNMNTQAIIFALANPEPEIKPDLAKRFGAFITATGRSDFSNQINNVLVFPGIFKGMLQGRIKTPNDNLKIKAAIALASMVKPNVNRILPGALNKNIVNKIAKAIINN